MTVYLIIRLLMCILFVYWFSPWLHIVANGCTWFHMVTHGYAWVHMVIHGYTAYPWLPSISMVTHGTHGYTWHTWLHMVTQYIHQCGCPLHPLAADLYTVSHHDYTMSVYQVGLNTTP